MDMQSGLVPLSVNLFVPQPPINSRSNVRGVAPARASIAAATVARNDHCVQSIYVCELLASLPLLLLLMQLEPSPPLP